jgi:tRNA threonylcarbamoyladenosine biosynthesis protein TsaE
MSCLVKLESLEATRHLANTILERCPFGTLLLLTGPMGVGKTTLVQNFAAELNSTARVTSPTYTLIHEYPTPSGILIHIDAFRLHGSEPLIRFGLDDYLQRSRIVVVEWGENLREPYPEASWVHLTFEEGIRCARLLLPRSSRKRVHE